MLCLYVVVGGSIAPYLLVAAALRHLPATSVGILGMIEPVIATAVAWLVLSETLNLPQLAGGALVLAGVVAGRDRPGADGRRATHRPASPPWHHRASG